MRIDAFLHESPMFAVNRAARRFESLAAKVIAPDGLSFLEGLVLAAFLFSFLLCLKPLHIADTFGSIRGIAFDAIFSFIPNCF